MPRILISGAGIAGTTLAYWLRRRGFEPTVVERAGPLRSSGNPVDVEGEAVAVAERMRLMPKLSAAATGSTGITFVDGAGRRVGRINLEAIRRASRSGNVELGRSDLAAILHEAAGSDVDFRFGDSLASLAEDGHGAEVVFESGGQERFDLVVGADGLHSAAHHSRSTSGAQRHRGASWATPSRTTAGASRNCSSVSRRPTTSTSTPSARSCSTAGRTHESP
jgi:2-polyprenyl-6-methoxyphenol hydroxylase-like FAD-dependent oxidoreductase